MGTRGTDSTVVKASGTIEKAERETPTNLEHMENDELWRMRTGSSASNRKGDQPEEATVKEHRVDDIVMDQGPRDAGVTKMRMDEILMIRSWLFHVGLHASV